LPKFAVGFAEKTKLTYMSISLGDSSLVIKDTYFLLLPVSGNFSSYSKSRTSIKERAGHE
jgi:hypothetical protein